MLLFQGHDVVKKSNEILHCVDLPERLYLTVKR